MKFNSAQEIYRELERGKDLYFENSGVYVFLYAERGSIAYYYLPKEELIELAHEVVGYEESISSALGPGGYILDPDIILKDGTLIEYGTSEYSEYESGGWDDDWAYDFAPIYDFLARFVGEECIYAMPEDLAITE